MYPTPDRHGVNFFGFSLEDDHLARMDTRKLRMKRGTIISGSAAGGLLTATILTMRSILLAGTSIEHRANCRFLGKTFSICISRITKARQGTAEAGGNVIGGS